MKKSRTERYCIPCAEDFGLCDLKRIQIRTLGAEPYESQEDSEVQRGEVPVLGHTAKKWRMMGWDPSLGHVALPWWAAREGPGWVISMHIVGFIMLSMGNEGEPEREQG